jgi:hypothetical protein
MGSGTALVEAVVNGRKAYGTDINPVAFLISKSKTTHIDPLKLDNQISLLISELKPVLKRDTKQMLLTEERFDFQILTHERIDYWFPEKQKHDLALILSRKQTALSLVFRQPLCGIRVRGVLCPAAGLLHR